MQQDSNHPPSDLAELILTGAASRILDVSAETVRVWERQGLLTARKTMGGVRLFDRQDIERLANERRAAEHRS
jgi:DNA-binding transcriptional MerR regulator